MSDTEVHRIAASLSKAQRKAVVDAFYCEADGVWHPAGWYAMADRRVRYALACANITRDYVRDLNRLTPLGERVRAYLTGEPQ